MWTDVKLKSQIDVENLKLAKLKTDKESFAACGQWSVVNALKVEIGKSMLTISIYQKILESDE